VAAATPLVRVPPDPLPASKSADEKGASKVK
jgi:hypothetical protein